MSGSSDSLRRWEPYAGVAYVVFFLASMMVSNPPADNASNQKWIQSYASHHEQIHHLATGFLLLLAGLSLMTFLVALWRRIAAAHPAEPSRLPVAAAGAAAALIGAGGMVMAYISGGELLGHYPLPSVDLLRMSNDLGFALAGVAGSWAAGSRSPPSASRATPRASSARGCAHSESSPPLPSSWRCCSSRSAHYSSGCSSPQ